MIRIKRGNVAAKRRKKYFKLARGYFGSHSRSSTMICEQVVQSQNFAYIGRKLRKRHFRKIWISRINSVNRLGIYTYSKFMGLLKKINIFLDRKILAFFAFYDILTFTFLENQIMKANKEN